MVTVELTDLEAVSLLNCAEAGRSAAEKVGELRDSGSLTGVRVLLTDCSDPGACERACEKLRAAQDSRVAS